MSNITIIGNNASNQNVSDGGRLKIRLYLKLLKELGIGVNIIDLEGWKIKVFSIIIQIKKAIKRKDTILIMAGPNGCRYIIPLVNFLNRKSNTRVVFSPLGVGTVDVLIKKMNTTDTFKFINSEDFLGIKDEKMRKELEKLDLIIPQNEKLVTLYKKFYNLSNVKLLYNFRDCQITEKDFDSKKDELSIIYASRVCEEKGIFLLMDAVKILNDNNYKITLSIFGELQLTKKEKEHFDSALTKNIKYLGVLEFQNMIEIMKHFDLFCLPTKYHGEGTSGAVIEAFIAGTPVLISSYSQAHQLIKSNKDGFIFKIGDKEDLIEKLTYIYHNKQILPKISHEAQKNAEKYVFEYNKDNFIECIIGKEK